jgi:peptide/nickel transport system permease protein
MCLTYVLKRFGIFVLIVWLASSVNFFLPRLGGQDPMRAHLLEQAMLGGYVQAGLEEMVSSTTSSSGWTSRSGNST